MATEIKPPMLPSFHVDNSKHPSPVINTMRPPLGHTASIDLTGESDDEDATAQTPPASDQAQTTTRSSPSTFTHKPLYSSNKSSPSSSLYPSYLANNTQGEDGIQFTGANITAAPVRQQPPQHMMNSNGTNGHRFHPSPSNPSVLAHPSQAYYNQSMGNTPGSGWTSHIPLRSPAPNYSPSGYNTFTPLNNSEIQTISTWTPPPGQEKKVICIGAVSSRVRMLYPAPAAFVGAQPPEGVRERYTILQYKHAEMIKVKLKLRNAGVEPKEGEPWPSVRQPTIQVMTPAMSSYLGELDPALGNMLLAHVSRGLLRLEGFVVRLQADSDTWELKINVLLFTLPSNVKYITDTLIANNTFLLDPIPPYDPDRHNDRPDYHNGHGSGDAGQQLQLRWHNQRDMYMNVGGAYGGHLASQAKTVSTEVLQQRQVEEVFKHLENPGELEVCLPGVLVKTPLYDHQQKGLSFMLQREQDWKTFKTCRKAADKEMKKQKGLIKGEKALEADAEVKKEEAKVMKPSIWEPQMDDRGRIRTWKNRMTDEVVKGKKGDRPLEGKGAILADDMGLGKTLSTLALIAATRKSARKWAKQPLEEVKVVEEAKGSDARLSDMKTRVFGMPDIDEDVKGKKRKRDDAPVNPRRARIATRSRATLLICPMSTIQNWEAQLREHWNGKVEVVNGPQASSMPWKRPESRSQKKKGPKLNLDVSDSSDDSDESADDILNDVLRVYTYYGQPRRSDPEFVADFDVVITSYNLLSGEYGRQGGTGDGDATPGETAGNSGDEGVKPEVQAEIRAIEVADALFSRKGKGKVVKDYTSPLQAIDWFRVVLDEAHTIKSDKTVGFKAACDLEADRRLALSGTPIQNRIEDIYALFHFLRLNPVDEKEQFQALISEPCKRGSHLGIARLRTMMSACTLRRMKDSKNEHGVPIVDLPTRKEVQLWLELREDEREVYETRKALGASKLKEYKQNKEDKVPTGGDGMRNVLSEMLRLRQICDHVDLAMMGAVEEDYDGTIMDYEVAIKGIEANGLNQARAVSVICFQKVGRGALCTGCNLDYGEYFPTLGLNGEEEIEADGERCKAKKAPSRPVLTKCQHLFCPKCFKSSIYSDWSRKMKGSAGRQCQCGDLLRLPHDAIEVIPPNERKEEDLNALSNDPPKRAARKKYVRPLGEKPSLSTKMQYLHDELIKFSKQNPHSVNYDVFGQESAGEDVALNPDGTPAITKSVVFSQWTTMLDRVGDMLEEMGIKYARLDGTMSREERNRSMALLKDDKKVEILLVSTKAGGVGLNLTAACRAYLIDPYWNPSVEQQAIDRIHRLGQTRPVTAIKLMIRDSIEEQLDKLQKKKADLANLSLKHMSRADLQAQKEIELMEIFG